jgi:hypothetical protein
VGSQKLTVGGTVNIIHTVEYLKVKKSDLLSNYFYLFNCVCTRYNQVSDTCTFIMTVPPTVSFGIPKCTINVDTLDLFSRRPDDDSIELKHVALSVII